MSDTTERARRIIDAAEEMRDTADDDRSEMFEIVERNVLALAAELAAAEKRNAGLAESLRAACDALGEIYAKPYRAEEVVRRWMETRTEAAMAKAAAASEGKP